MNSGSRVKPRTLFSAMLLLPVSSAFAHHSFTAEFDINKPMTLTGTVTRVEWTNPHAWFYIDVEEEGGNVRNYAIELLGINRLLRSGWSRNKIKPGDVLFVEGFRGRRDPNIGNASVVIIVETGEQIWGSVADEEY